MAATRRAGLDQDDRWSCRAAWTDRDAGYTPPTAIESMAVVHLAHLGRRTADPLGHGHLGEHPHLDETQRWPESRTQTKSWMGRGEEAATQAALPHTSATDTVSSMSGSRLLPSFFSPWSKPTFGFDFFAYIYIVYKFQVYLLLDSYLFLVYLTKLLSDFASV